MLSPQSWFKRRQAQDRDLDDEIHSHLAMAVADRIARGESPENALAAARREFGNVAHVKEVTRETWGGAGFERLAQDLRYAARSLRRAPAFTTTAVLTLALGIGVTSAMFTVVKRVLLQPLPFPSPNELFVVSHVPDQLIRVFGRSMPDGEFIDFTRATRAFRSVASFRTYPATLLGGGEPARVPVAAVTSGFFATIGVRPRAGRAFAVGDDRPGSDGVAIVSARLSRARFGSDSAAIGRSITLEGYHRTVVGVMPDGFEFPRRSEVWIPLSLALDPHNTRLQVVVGRLGSASTQAQASSELRSFADREEMRDTGTAREHYASTITPLRDEMVGDVRVPLLVFTVAVAMLLLIACANVSNLMLMRAMSRRHELAIRAALGAGRIRLVRQLLTESVVVASAGGLLGLVCAFAGVRFVLALLPPGALPRAAEVHVDPVVVVVTAIASLLAGVFAGTLPAVAASGRDVREALSEAGRTTARMPFQRVFVAMETGLSLILLVAAGLMIRSFVRLQSVDLGFTPGNLVTATLDFPETKYRTAESVQQVTTSIAERIGSLPGVRAVAAVNWLPLDSSYIAGDFTLRDGRALPRGYTVLKPCVTANYFPAMGIRVREGRGFVSSDDGSAAQVVVISESMATTLWPNGGAVGQLLTFADEPGPGDWMRVVGVVDDVVRSGPAEGPMPALYRPIAQVQQLFFISHLTFVARTDGDPSGMIGLVRSAVHAADPDQPIHAIATMESRLSATIAEPRFRWAVLVIFSTLALVMAAIGIYGVLTYAVNERQRELGIRMAIGASPQSISRLVIIRAAWSGLPGLLLGLVGALAAGRLVARFLFEIQPGDPITFVVASALLVLTVLAAGLGPARRAGRIDPAITMKGA
jgi:putative ABC transport system permease protein